MSDAYTDGDPDFRDSIDGMANLLTFRPVYERGGFSAEEEGEQATLGSEPLYRCSICTGLALESDLTAHREYHLMVQQAQQHFVRLADSVEQLARHILRHNDDIDALKRVVRLPGV